MYIFMIMFVLQRKIVSLTLMERLEENEFINKTNYIELNVRLWLCFTKVLHNITIDVSLIILRQYIFLVLSVES